MKGSMSNSINFKEKHTQAIKFHKDKYSKYPKKGGMLPSQVRML